MAQHPGGYSKDDLNEIQNYVGIPDSVIEQRFGKPDEIGFEEGKQAVVWTYITKVSGETSSSNPIAGYHQFAFWNGKVAGYRTRLFTDIEQATAIYDSTLAYMAEDGRTVGSVGSADPSMFTENLRVSQRGENFWNVDMLRDELNSHATIIIGNTGYRSCEKNLIYEAKRVEDKYGIKITEDGRIETQ